MKVARYALPALLLTATLCPAAEQTPSEAAMLAVLKSDAPLHEKATACRRLATAGTARAVPVLAGLLAEQRLGDYARLALEAIPDPSVDQALRDATRTLRGRLLAGVVNSLGVRRDARAVPRLIELARDGAAGVREPALAALGRIASPQAVEAVKEALGAASAALRAAAADACLAAADRLARANRPADARALYAAVRRADVPEHIAAAATFHAIVLGGPAGVETLRANLRSGRPAFRAAALRAARALPGPAVTEALSAELDAAPPDLQVLLIQLLAERRAPRLAGRLARLAAAAGAAESVRIEALRALGQVGDAASVSVLAAAAGQPDPAGAAAKASLRRLDAKGVDAAILAAMKQAAGSLRAELIAVLVDRRFTPAAEPLLAEAASEDPVVAAAALKALPVLGGPKHLPAAVQCLLKARDDRTRSAAEDAVAALAARLPDPDARADVVLDALAKSADPAVRARLLRTAGRIGGAKALAALTAALDDPAPAVVDAAVRGLAAWPDARALPTLRRLLDGASDPAHRVLALRGCVRLLAASAGADPRGAARRYAELLSRARRPDERKLILARLADVPCPEALDLALGRLDDPAVRSEAALAAVAVARATLGADPAATRKAMNRVVAAVRTGPIAAQARAVLSLLEKAGDCILAWRIAGPYTKKGLNYAALFDTPFPPELPGAKGVAWKPIGAGTDPKRPWILDLKKALGGEQRVAYALTWLYSPVAQPARLELGSDDGVKVWLNGRLVHANNVARAAVAYTDRAEITLRAGWNSLLLKITQNNLPWEFCARVRDRSGRAVEGLRIDPTHAGDPMSAPPPAGPARN